MGSKIYKVLFMLIGIGTLAYMIHAIGTTLKILAGGFCLYLVAGQYSTG